MHLVARMGEWLNGETVHVLRVGWSMYDFHYKLVQSGAKSGFVLHASLTTPVIAQASPQQVHQSVR